MRLARLLWGATALVWLATMSVHAQTDAKTFLERAVEEERHGQHDAAIGDCSEAIALDPRNGDAYECRAKCKLEKHDFAGAISDLSAAIELKPADSTAWSERARARQNQGDLEGALADCSKVIELRPTDFSAYLQRGLTRRQQGELDLALEDYAMAIRLSPSESEAYVARGTARRDKGDLQGAMTDYTHAIELSPSDHVAYGDIGYLLYNQRSWPGALLNFKKAAQLEPSEPYYSIRIVLIEARTHQQLAADVDLTLAVQNLKPDSDSVWPSKVLRFLGHHMSETDFLASAQSDTPRETNEQRCEAYYYLGTMRLIQGDSTKAADYFHQCVGTQVTYFEEYSSAQAELQALSAGAQPGTP